MGNNEAEHVQDMANQNKLLEKEQKQNVAKLSSELKFLEKKATKATEESEKTDLDAQIVAKQAEITQA